MKHFICFLMAATLTLAWTGCGDSDDEELENLTNPTEEEEEEPQQETEQYVARILASDNAALASLLASLVDGVELDSDGNALIYQRAIDSTASLDLSGKGLTSLSGIEYFTNLTSLNVSSNALTSIDLSALANLASLNVSDNNLTELDLSNNTAITSLLCYSNNLTTLDISALTALETLLCGQQQTGTLTLTLTDSQSTTWYSTWQTLAGNTDVSPIQTSSGGNGSNYTNGGKF